MLLEKGRIAVALKIKLRTEIVMKFWSTPDLKKFNKERIRKEIQKCDKCTKAIISRTTELSLVTCNSLLNEMLTDHEILETEQKELIMGRPAAQFFYNRDYLHVLGLWVSDEKNINVIDCVTADAMGTQLCHVYENPEVISYDAIESIIEDQIKKDPLIRRVSIGIPGVTLHGVVESCDVSSLVGVSLESNLQKKFGIDVEVRNDMDYMAYGIYHTTYSGDSNLAVVYFPTDNLGAVGSGYMINGRVLRGYSRYSGMLPSVLEGFGISREEQIKIINSEEDFVSYIQKLVIIISAMIDPEEIHLLGIDLSKEQMDQIYEFAENILTRQHTPKLILNSDAENQYRTGLIRVGINRMLFPFSDPV